MDRPPANDDKRQQGIDARADLGVRGEDLPTDVAKEYFVETSYGDEVGRLLAGRGTRPKLLQRLAPVLHERFGCNARLMLAAPWSLFEPIGPRLQLTVFTPLDENAAADAAKAVEAEWSSELESNEISLVPIPFSRLSDRDKRRSEGGAR